MSYVQLDVIANDLYLNTDPSIVHTTSSSSLSVSVLEFIKIDNQ